MEGHKLEFGNVVLFFRREENQKTGRKILGAR